MDNEFKKDISKSSLGAGLILVGVCCGGLVIWLASIAGGGGLVALIAGYLVRNLFFISIGIILLSLAVYFLVNRPVSRSLLASKRAKAGRGKL